MAAHGAESPVDRDLRPDRDGTWWDYKIKTIISFRLLLSNNKLLGLFLPFIQESRLMRRSILLFLYMIGIFSLYKRGNVIHSWLRFVISYLMKKIRIWWWTFVLLMICRDLHSRTGDHCYVWPVKSGVCTQLPNCHLHEVLAGRM